MSRESNLSKKNSAGYYQSTYNTTREFNKNNYDVLTVRVPKGAKEILKAHQQQMHQQYPENPKYASLNSMINNLLDAEIAPNE